MGDKEYEKQEQIHLWDFEKPKKKKVQKAIEKDEKGDKGEKPEKAEQGDNELNDQNIEGQLLTDRYNLGDENVDDGNDSSDDEFSYLKEQ